MPNTQETAGRASTRAPKPWLY